MITNITLPLKAGAGSFKRMLGCAPISVAQILPCPDAWVPRHRFHRTDLGSDGRMDRRSELTTSPPPARHNACTDGKSALRNDLYGTDVGNLQEQLASGFHNNSLVLLSCAA